MYRFLIIAFRSNLLHSGLIHFDDKLIIVLVLFPENRTWHYAICLQSTGDNLHEMTKLVFWERKKNKFNISSVENVYPTKRYSKYSNRRSSAQNVNTD